MPGPAGDEGRGAGHQGRFDAFDIDDPASGQDVIDFRLGMPMQFGIMASLFGVARLEIGDAVYASDAGVFSDVWGKDVVVAYTNTASVAEM